MTPDQCRAARALLDMSQDQLANISGVAVSTIIPFEKSQRAPRQSTISAIRAALESAGVIFLDPNGEGAGVRLRKE